jgi:hypothetical protein
MAPHLLHVLAAIAIASLRGQWRCTGLGPFACVDRNSLSDIARPAQEKAVDRIICQPT